MTPRSSRRTLPTVVASQLGHLIISGRLRPGTKLVETELARRLRVSRAPIREAIRELERQGLVTNPSRRSARVIEPSPRDVKEINEVKASLEGLGARLAAERITPAELAGLKATYQRMERLADRGARAAYVEATRHFHQAFIKASGNSRLIQMYETMSRQIWWLATMVLVQSDRHVTSVREHKEILDALVSRDGKRAQAVAEDHVRRGGDFFFEQFLLGKVGPTAHEPQR